MAEAPVTLVNPGNPYVGPRPFEENERDVFFGRRTETQQLADLVIAQRAVVFHAPSGAGKTSLLKASLIPTLRRLKRLVILPITRVSGDLPPELDPASVANIYVFNALVGLFGQEAQAADLAGRSLREGVAQWLTPQADETRLRPRLLIIDQFEELFTTHLQRHPERSDFFRQLQECLVAFPQLSLLLAMREDYIANLDFYAAQLPDRLRTRFRIERLSDADALAAITGPAQRGGRKFDVGVAEALVDNLRRVQLGEPDRDLPRVTVALGAFIEPVHLQIVCRQLWDKLPPERTLIRAEDVQQFGDVDQALIDFYENAIAQVCSQTELSQRHVRSWFGDKLITPARTRGLVYRGADETAGLPNEAVEILADAYLIRADIRGSDAWYELAHDRLVDPVQTANATWQRTYVNPLAAPTQAWLQQGRDPAKVLRGPQLAEAAAFAKANPRELLPEEEEFLADSQRIYAAEQAAARQATQRRRTMAIIALVVIAALAGLTMFAWRNANIAQEQRDIADTERAAAVAAADLAQRAEATAEANRVKAEAAKNLADEQARLASGRAVAAAAISNLETDPELSILLAMQAISITYTSQAEDALHQAIQASRVRRTFLGHTGAVNAVAVNSDGAYLATAGADGLVKLWDLASGREVATIAGHRAAVNAVDFSPDGMFLATAADDGHTFVWDVSNRDMPQLALDLTGHNAQIVAVVFSPDGTRLATSGADGAIRLWSLSRVSWGQELGQLSEPPDALVISNAIAFSADSARLAAGRADGSLIIWGVQSGRKLLTLPGHKARVFGVAFSPDGDQLVSGGWDGAKLWDLTTATEIQSLTGHTAEVRAVAFSSDGTRIATASDDQRAKVWDVATGIEILTLAGHKGAVSAVAFTPDGRDLITASADGTARAWDIGPNEEVLTLADPGEEFYRAVYAPAGAGLATLENNGIAKLWNLVTGQVMASVRVHPVGADGSAAFSGDGTHLAVGVSRQPPMVWSLTLADLASGQPIFTLPVSSRAAYLATALDFNGERLALADADHNIRVWSVPTATLLYTLTGHTDLVNSIAFSRDGAWIATASADGSARLWDAQTGAAHAALRGHNGEVRTVAFGGQPAAESSLLATGGADGLAKVWDVATGAELVTFSGHTARLSSVAFSPDGLRLATASGDQTAKVWDIASGRELLTFGGHSEAVVQALFSPDERHLVTLGLDGTVRIYSLDVAKLIDIARSRVTRPLTTQECNKHLQLDACP